MYQAINNPVNYGGLELKNRIIFAPTTFGLSDEEYFAFGVICSFSSYLPF